MYRYNPYDNRFAGGFLGPFILGGITGGLVSPLFYNGNNYQKPYCYNCYYTYPMYYR